MLTEQVAWTNVTLTVPRNLHLKFGQNQISNSWYISDMDKCWLDKYHHNGCAIFSSKNDHEIETVVLLTITLMNSIKWVTTFSLIFHFHSKISQRKLFFSHMSDTLGTYGNTLFTLLFIEFFRLPRGIKFPSRTFSNSPLFLIFSYLVKSRLRHWHWRNTRRR